MRSKIVAARLFLATSSCALATAALASESTTYTYDALGRLTGSTITGGPNNSRQTKTCFDHAGNRMRYDSTTGTPAACPPPPPPPPSSP
jgi:YD repeat-containing protein